MDAQDTATSPAPVPRKQRDTGGGDDATTTRKKKKTGTGTGTGRKRAASTSALDASRPVDPAAGTAPVEPPSSPPTPAPVPSSGSSSLSSDELAPRAPAPMLSAGSSKVLSFEMLQLARQQSSGVLLGNLRKPLSIEFRNLDYWVSIQPTQMLAPLRGLKPTPRQILFDVSGACMPGECLAVMGPSGGGKTTLLQLLAGRIDGSYRGDVIIDGQPATKAYKKYMAFVLQDDILFSHLTVKETLTYTGLLRLPREMSYEDKLRQVDYVIGVLGLRKCQNTKIGNVFSRGISGGERKRTSIASELLTNPSIIFLDEPTSGLDATMAYNLVQTLKSLARNEGRTILCSIHQPSSQCFFSFDKLLLLADGHVTYNGPVNGVVDWFARIGYNTPKNYNPADYFMALLVDSDDTKKKCIEAYENHPTTIKADEKRAVQDTALIHGSEDENSTRIWEATWAQQVWILTQRGLRSSVGDLYSYLNMTQMTIVSVISGLIWLQTPLTEQGAQDRSGLIFFLSVFWSFQALFMSILTFPAERAVYLKERSSRAYRLSAWFLAKSVTEMVVISALPLACGTMTYFMVGLQYTFQNWISFILVLMVTVWTMQSFAILVASVVFDMQKSITTAGTFMLSTMLLGGFYSRNVPYWLLWARYLSITNYSYGVLMGIDFNENLVIACNAENSLYTECLSSATFDGPAFLRKVNVDQRAGLFIGVLFIVLVSFRVLAYLALRFRK